MAITKYKLFGNAITLLHIVKWKPGITLEEKTDEMKALAAHILYLTDIVEFERGLLSDLLQDPLTLKDSIHMETDLDTLENGCSTYRHAILVEFGEQTCNYCRAILS